MTPSPGSVVIGRKMRVLEFLVLQSLLAKSTEHWRYTSFMLMLSPQPLSWKSAPRPARITVNQDLEAVWSVIMQHMLVPRVVRDKTPPFNSMMACLLFCYILSTMPMQRFHILIVGDAKAGKSTLLKKWCETDAEPIVRNWKGEQVTPLPMLYHVLLIILE